MASFPEPLIDCSEVPAKDLRLWNPDTGHRPDDTWAGLDNQEDAEVLAPSVPPLYNRPQGEMLRALCDSLIPVFREKPQMTQDLVSENLSDLLTRKGVSPLCSLTRPR